MNNMEINSVNLDLDQPMMITKREHLSTVITTTEASEILGVDKTYLIKLINKGEFQDWEYRKTGKVVLFRLESINTRIGKFKNKTKSKVMNKSKTKLRKGK